MGYQTDVPFNPAPPRIMHIDLNSCFASVEQQANPLLRGKPVVVAAYAKKFGCILAPSIEAKLYGIKTGMTVEEGQKRCPYLIVREADPPKYREVHKCIGQLLSEYSAKVISKSIDEYALDFSQSPARYTPLKTAREIKHRIKSEIGSHLRTSVGISTNQILAKLGSGLHKPDGLDVIDRTNYIEIYRKIKLQDFCGINVKNEARLNRVGVHTALQFYQGSIQRLCSAFESVMGRYWYTRLRGYEIDDIEFSRRSFGQSYVLPRPMEYGEWRPILAKLAVKAARRLRRDGYLATGIHLFLLFGDHTKWHTGRRGATALYDDPSLLQSALTLYEQSAPKKRVKKLAVSFFGLQEDSGQLNLLVDKIKQKDLVSAIDKINDKWGEYALTYGSFLGSIGHVRDAIAFGK